MNRSGYIDDYDFDNLVAGRWRGMVASSIRGARGQAFLREMLEALDAMPEKRLIAHDLISEGEVCAIGTVGIKRGLEMSEIDVEDYDYISSLFGIAAPLVQEIEYINDECGPQRQTPEDRWSRVRAWVVRQINPAKALGAADK